MLESYAKDILKREKATENLMNKAIEKKLIDALKEKVTLEPKSVTIEEFRKLLEEAK